MSNDDNLVESQKKRKLEIFIYHSRLKLHTENMIKDHSYCKNIINDIIYNEKAHIVAVFKDYLIYDDTSEFLKRFYKVQESKSRLMKIFEFYDSYSKIFPNYTGMTEAKYIYKNIQRKQKMIDHLHRKFSKGKSEKMDKSNPDDKIFVTDVYDSIMNLTVCTVKYDDTKYTNPPTVQTKDKTYKKELNLSIKIEDSNHTLEGLIDNIGKAEESSFKLQKGKPSLKKKPSSTKEVFQINNQNKAVNRNYQQNMNKFNKKTDLRKQSIKKKLDFSPSIKMNKGKESSYLNKQASPIAKTVFKSIQLNDQLKINSLLDSVNQHPNVLNRRESFLTKSTIVEEKKPPETERELKNEISHRFTLSIPKNAFNNHIYNNFNFINNIHQADGVMNNGETAYSQINIINELSPKINSARVIQKFEMKKEEINNNNKIIQDVNKNKNINTSHSVNLNSNLKEDKNQSVVRLRKNHTKSNILKQNEGRNNPVMNSTLKPNLYKNNSSHLNNPSNSKTNLKLNTIKAPSYVNDNNSITLSKRDRVVSLTARQFIQEDSTNVKVIKGKTSEEVGSSQNFSSNLQSNYKQINLINSSRLLKNSVSNGKTSSIKVSNTLDKKKEFSSNKLIKRNYSETYKAFNQSKGGEGFNKNLEKNKTNINLKKKSQKNFSVENKSESTSISKARINSGKTSTLSPKKNSQTTTTKSSTFKPSEVIQKEIKAKQLNQVKSLSRIQTINVSSHNYMKSNSSRIKMMIDENKKSPIIYLK